MSINHAILGLLSYRPMSGYDLKKLMQDSPFMYWSGNNNQVYKALVELGSQGLVTSETKHQDGSPTKKIYTLTDSGLAELNRWTLIAPEAPETKNAFLVQLAWTWQLSDAELAALLEQYKQEVSGALLIRESKSGEKAFSPSRTPRERAIWDLIHENALDSLRQELRWIERVQAATASRLNEPSGQADASTVDDGIGMNYQVIDNDAARYILLKAEGKPLQTEQDALDLITVCAQHATNMVLIPGERLAGGFFWLRTGMAGAILQKLTMYDIKVAVVLDDMRPQGKFKEFLAESNRGKMFRSFSNLAEAENWLITV